MRPYCWRTRNDGWVYVDSMTGCDMTGDGTQGNPYKTLGRAYRGSSVAPGTIVCRGRFCEDMADGNHGTMIRGDYMGAATFDGEGVYVMYGFGHINMIIENCTGNVYGLTVNRGSVSLAGVGRSFHGGAVGYAHYVGGVAGSSVIVGRSPLHMGCIGGNAAARYIGIWRPGLMGGTKLWYGGGE